MLSGNGGQKVDLVPSLDLIAVFTRGSFNAESPVNAMMTEILLPAFLPPPAPSSPRDQGTTGPR